MSKALSFSSAPNPVPYEGATATWVVANYEDDHDVIWSAEPDGIVAIEPFKDQHHKATLTVKALGMALVTASQKDRTSVSRYVCAGEILAYDAAGALYAAQSQSWTLLETGRSAPALTWNGVEQCYALDIQQLNTIRGGDGTTTVFFNVEAASRTPVTPVQGSPGPLVIVAPDGSRWQSSVEGWQPVPPGEGPIIPPPEEVRTLAWAPPGPTPTQPSFNVTCYILNQPGLDEARGPADYDVPFDVNRR